MLLATAELRSFRAAANKLGVSRSAVSHAIRNLELDLGTRLLNRTTRSVSPTAAGTELIASLRTIFSDLDTALEQVEASRTTPSGLLRINTSKGGLRLLMEEIVPHFLQAYPEVELDLRSEGRLVDIVAEGFDAGVRLREAIPNDMVAVTIRQEMRFLACASPAYLDEAGTPATPQDLLRHRCVRQRLPSGKRYAWEFAWRGQEARIDPPGPLTLDDYDAMTAAAEKGLGIIYIPETLVQPALRAGRLTTILDNWCPAIPGLALYYPSARHTPPALRAFIDTIRACAHETRNSG